MSAIWWVKRKREDGSGSQGDDEGGHVEWLDRLSLS